MRHGIRFHRYGLEIDDPKILHALHELYVVYAERRRTRRLRNPISHVFAPERMMNLSEFTLMIIQTGIDVTKQGLTGGKPK